MEQLPSPTAVKAKKLLLDPYASIALADAEENNRRIQEELDKVRCAGQKSEAGLKCDVRLRMQGADARGPCLKQGAAPLPASISLTDHHLCSSQEQRRKAEVRRALDEQVRLKKSLEIKEKSKNDIWLEQEQVRLKVLEVREAKKAAEVAEREHRILAQRRQQLVEREAIKQREMAEKRAFETEILRSIQRDMIKERETDITRKRAEAKNMEMVIAQNEKNKVIALQLKEKEAAYIRQVEEEAKEVAERKTAMRVQAEKDRLSKVGTGRGAQGGETMQERLQRLVREDEARADARIAKDAADATAKIEAEKRWRAELQRDTLDVLAVQECFFCFRGQDVLPPSVPPLPCAIACTTSDLSRPMSRLPAQVKEKELRKQADLKYREKLVSLNKEQVINADKMERMRRDTAKQKNMAYADELKAQIRMQQERKLMEPFLMSKAERQMNASLLRRTTS